MQFFILFTGAMVFVFYTFEQPPHNIQHRSAQGIPVDPRIRARLREHQNAWEQRRRAAGAYLRRNRDERALDACPQDANQQLDAARKEISGNDANSFFSALSRNICPQGFVGLIMAAIFAAAMSTISAEVNSLATVSVIDIYRRHVRSGTQRTAITLRRRNYSPYSGAGTRF